jgi:hypothetical protein
MADYRDSNCSVSPVKFDNLDAEDVGEYVAWYNRTSDCKLSIKAVRVFPILL